MRLGFTGTQEGMTKFQAQRFRDLLLMLCVTELHHGDCIGADRNAHLIALNHSLNVESRLKKIVIHPPVNDYKRAFCNRFILDSVEVEILSPKDYLLRNEDIVRISDMMCATPKEFDERLRSGTWYTIRKARKWMKNCYLILPDGTTKLERWVV